MPPRPTPRQRAVLEAMSDGTALRYIGDGRPWTLDNGGGDVLDVTVTAIWQRQWIKRVDHGVYVITESGRRAVAREIETMEAGR